MAGLNCGVTLTLLGILVLGATLSRGGAGECGAGVRAALSGLGGRRAGARRGGYGGAPGRRVQSWSGGRAVGVHRRRGSLRSSDSGARRVGRSGGALLGSE